MKYAKIVNVLIMKLNRILLICYTLLTAILVFLVIKFPTNRLDTNITDYFYNIRNDSLTVFFKIISYIGSAYGVIIILLIILIAFWKDKRALWLISLVIISAVLSSVIKVIIARERPDELMRLMTENSKSFPSGHSMQAMALYGSIVYLVIINKIKHKAWIIFGSILMIILMGISRIYLGVHYFTDVIGAYAIGLLVILTMALVFKKYTIKEKRDN